MGKALESNHLHVSRGVAKPVGRNGNRLLLEKRQALDDS